MCRCLILGTIVGLLWVPWSWLRPDAHPWLRTTEVYYISLIGEKSVAVRCRSFFGYCCCCSCMRTTSSGVKVMSKVFSDLLML